METYVAEIGGKAVLAFRAEADDGANAVIDDDRGAMRSDLRALTGTDGNPLWDGKSVIHVRLATATEHAEWEQSRDQAISDGEIDLNAGDDPDEWNVSFPRCLPTGILLISSVAVAPSTARSRARSSS